MKQILQGRNLWAIITLVVVILVIPYSLCWFWYQPHAARQYIYDIRVDSAVGIFVIGFAGRIKIFCKEKLGWIQNQTVEDCIDVLLLNIPIVIGTAALFIYMLPALIISRILYKISLKKHADIKEVRNIIFALLTVFLILLFFKNKIIISFAIFLMFVTAVKIFLYWSITFISSVKNDELFVDRIIAGLYWALTQSYLWVSCAPYKIHGELPKEKFQAIYSNHGGFPEYFLVMILKCFLPVKPLAGSNLLKYPIFGDFIEVVCVITERPEGNVKSFPAWLLTQILKFLLWLSSLIRMKPRLEKTRVFKYLWNKATIQKSFKKNAENIVTIAEAILKGFIIFVFPDGRDRLSRFLARILKSHGIAVAEYVDVIVPVLFVGSMRYKPASSNEPLAKKKGWRFQRWLRPCTQHIHIFPPMYKKEGQTKKEFTEEIDAFLYQEHSKLGFTV